MKKVYIYLIILMALIGIFSGVFVNKLLKSKSDKLAEVIFSEVTDSCIEEKKKYEFAMLNLEETDSTSIKISPNTKISLKIYYKDCNHTIEKKQKTEQNLVNLTQEEFQSKYDDWIVEKFTEDNVVLYKEELGFCNEHYILKEENGYIVIYELNENHEIQLLKVTDIATKYLPKSDLLEIENGLTVYTKQELNRVLEDYE